MATMHHYHFKLFALDVALDLPGTAGLQELDVAMAGIFLPKRSLWEPMKEVTLFFVITKNKVIPAEALGSRTEKPGSPPEFIPLVQP